jgi:hypothetical protein
MINLYNNKNLNILFILIIILVIYNINLNLNKEGFISEITSSYYRNKRNIKNNINDYVIPRFNKFQIYFKRYY